MSDNQYSKYPCCGGLTFHRGGEACDAYRMAPEPPPKAVDGPAVWDLVMSDMAARDRVGTAKYGQRLVPGDGRDSLRDAYQEALDLAVYLRKAMYERDGR